MKNAARPDLRKCPKRGEEITVFDGRVDRIGVVLQGRVLKSAGGRSFTWRKVGPGARLFFAGTLRRRDEGITWARGWETEGALALRAQAALLRE